MFTWNRHHAQLRTDATLFTGACTPVTLAVARRLAGRGMALCVAHREPLLEPALVSLARQYPSTVWLTDDTPTTRCDARDLAVSLETACGPIGLWVHTLGTEAGPSGSSNGARRRPSPLVEAIACSLGAIDYLRTRPSGQLMHLFTQAEVGAPGMGTLAVAALRAADGGCALPPHVGVSAVSVDDRGHPGPAGSDPDSVGLLATYTMRAIEEDDRSAQIERETRIGNLFEDVLSAAQRRLGTLEDPHGSKGGPVAVPRAAA